MLDDAIRALAEPRRRAILRLIQDQELPAGKIAEHFDVTRPAISQHLAVLKAAGLITERREGTRRLYRARPEGFAELGTYIEEFWHHRLERLAAEAEAEERRFATVTTTSGSDVIEVERRIAAKPETVFSYFTDPEKMLRWMGVTADLDPKPGGIFRVNVTGKDIARGTYVEVTPHTRIVFTWGWEGSETRPGPGQSTVEALLAPDGDGTVLRIRHQGLTGEQRTGHAEGWNHYLDRLVVSAAGGDPGPDSWVETPRGP
jgi:uncharacterized protein YndB with AHSA1/START domain